MKKNWLKLVLLLLISTSNFGATIFQDNFEHNNIGVYIQKSETNGTITMSSTQAHSGTYSLKADITTNDGEAYIRPMYWGTGGLTDFRVRFWVYYGTDFTTDISGADGRVWYWISMYNAGYSDLIHIGALRSGGVNLLVIEYNGFSVYTAGVLPSASAWHCVEARIIKNASTGALYLWVDGVLVDTATGKNTGADAIQDWYVGALGTNDITATCYIDDIVIDNSNYIGTGWRVTEDGAVGSLYHN